MQLLCLPFLVYISLKKSQAHRATSVLASMGIFIILSSEALVKYVPLSVQNPFEVYVFTSC
jgi:hypothetical protein